jgi:MFS family permease
MIFRRFAFLIVAAVMMSALADYLFVAKRVGWSLSLFLTAAFVLLLLRGGAYLRSKSAIASCLLLFSLLIALAIQLGPLVLLMTLAALSMSAILIRQGKPWDAAEFVVTMLKFAVQSALQGIADMQRFRRFRNRNASAANRRRISILIRSWIFPIGGSLLFSSLFSMANPIISRQLQKWGLLLTDWKFQPDRWFLWFVAAGCTYALLRVRTKKARDPHARPPSLPMSIHRMALLRRSLWMFNAVFAVQTILDVAYLFGGFQLPEGMTYAAYAHRGSYPLIFTALLAAAFVLIAYRPGPASIETKTLRYLVLIWLAQNVFLTFTAAWRLHLYTEVYSLTRLRVAAGIWMFLVASGLAWIGLRISGGQTNRWLINRTLSTTFIVLYLCCFVNFDHRIAWHNARNCREVGGSGYYVDYAYMRTLGPEAIPALRWLQSRGVYPKTSGVLQKLSSELNLEMEDWRSWTVRRWVLWDGSMQ